MSPASDVELMAALDATTADVRSLDARHAALRSAASAEPYPSLALRRDRLARMRAMNEAHERDIAAAISADFGSRSVHETRLAECFMVHACVRHALRNLRGWMRPRRVPTPVYLRPGRSRVLRQPLGVVGVMSPWNYPYQLAMVPVVAAIAAGNRVMVKPSELAPSTSALLHTLIAARFDATEIDVVEGGPDVGHALASLPLDHLLFTGSTAVGRKIALAAARNLTPVTLELGGKSPAIVLSADAHERIAARIASGKLLNAGQTCIAPDYLLVRDVDVEPLRAAFLRVVPRLYPTVAGNPDYTAIASDAHHARLLELLRDAEAQGARVVTLADDPQSHTARARKIAPTLVLGVRAEMRIMREEIFGPLLPVETFSTLDEAIAIVNARPRPLAMYVFGGTTSERARVLERTHAGGVTLDDTMWHFANDALPFGGIGTSGMGAYHGERGFLTFTHEKPVFAQARLAATPLLYPPYGKRFERVVQLLKRLA
jgi:coniferyl-aldehyde dehydrogenase